MSMDTKAYHLIPDLHLCMVTEVGGHYFDRLVMNMQVLSMYVVN